MLKIYGADLSSPSNKVRYAANAMKLDYEYVCVKIKDGENKTDSFLKIHPAGKIPAIDDDGFVLFESNSIIKYLANKEKSELYPFDLRERALVDQWMNFISLHIDSAMGKVLFNRVFAPFVKVEVDERSVQDGLRFLERYLPIMDKRFSENDFVAGTVMTLADICLLSSLDAAEIGSVDLSVYERIVRWRNKLQEKDFYQKCHAKHGERLEKILGRK